MLDTEPQTVEVRESPGDYCQGHPSRPRRYHALARAPGSCHDVTHVTELDHKSRSMAF